MDSVQFEVMSGLPSQRKKKKTFYESLLGSLLRSPEYNTLLRLTTCLLVCPRSTNMNVLPLSKPKTHPNVTLPQCL